MRCLGVRSSVYLGKEAEVPGEENKSKCDSNCYHVYQTQASRKCTVRQIESGCLIKLCSFKGACEDYLLYFVGLNGRERRMEGKRNK